MFKTRKPTTQVTILSNPRIDFDYAELTKSAKLFLGKEKADKLLEAAFNKPKAGEDGPTNRNEKEFLILLALMEYAARYYRDNPQDEAKWKPEPTAAQEEEKDAPYFVPRHQNRGDAQSKSALDRQAISTRNHYVHEFLQVISLRTEKSYRLNLPYRLRNEAQRNSLITNRAEMIRDEKAKGTENEYKLRIHISTADLPRLTANLARGENQFSLKLDPNSQVPNKPMPIEIFWTDELPHRPELTRQILGRQTDVLLEDGRTALNRIGQEERGAHIHILGGNNCRGTYERTSQGEIQIQLEPMVDIKTGLEALENEVALMEYTNEQYSCSPQDFFEAIPQITQSLEADLEHAVRIWNNIPEGEEITESEKSNFLQEYNQTCLTLQTVPTPIGSISLNRMKEWKAVQGKDPYAREKGSFERAQNSRDLLEKTTEFLQNEEKITPVLELPFEKTIERVQEESFGNIASVNPGASISHEWMQEIAKSAVIDANPNPYENAGEAQERQIRALESVASALGVTPDELRHRRTLVLENFYGVGTGKSLDQHGPEKATFKGYALSDENRENFYQELEHFNQKDFESKGDKPLNADGFEVSRPELAAFVQNTKTIELEIPLNPTSLHRLTRYPTGLRASGKDVSRYPYGHQKHLPRDRGQKNNAAQELRLEDFLSVKGLEDYKALVQGNPDEATQLKIKKMQKTVENWNKGYGLIIPSRPSSPIDSRVGQWLTALLRAKKEGGHDEKKCQTVGELVTLLNCLSRIAGMKVGGVDTPLQTQPLPSVSNTIPLKLLCGVNPAEIKELQTLHENAIELRDMEARWENSLKANINQEPDFSRENKALNTLLESDQTERDGYNIESILQEPEDHLKNFNLAMGMKASGAENLDEELQTFRAVLPLLKSSPLTIKIEGEEMDLASLCSVASENMDPTIQEKFLSLSETERAQAENALSRRAILFKENLEKGITIISQLSKENNPLQPKGDQETQINFPEEDKDKEIEEVSAGLSDALLAVEEEEKRSGKTDIKWAQAITRAITNPNFSLIHFGENAEITVTKGKQGELTTNTSELHDKEPSTQATLTLKIIDAIAGKTTELPQETLDAIQGVIQEAKSQEILRNAQTLLETLKSIPKDTAKGGGINKEFQESKIRLSTIINLDKTQKNLDFQAKNWGYFEETHNSSIESAQVVFDFQRELEGITKKGFGNNPDMEPLRVEFLAKNGDEARKIYLSQGEDGTRQFLRQKGEEFFQEEKNRASHESSRLLKTVTDGIQKVSNEITPEGKVSPSSKNDKLKAAFEPETGLFHKICSLVETNNTLTKKIKEAERSTEILAKSLAKNQPKPKQVIPQSIIRGNQNAGIFQIKGNKVLTDKIWIKDILESKAGQEKLQMGEIATRWACEAKTLTERRERAALLIYLKGQGLQKEALKASLTEKGKEALDKISNIWSKKLRILHIDGDKKINTLLAGTAALQQLEAETLLGKELITTIQKEAGITTVVPKQPKVELQFSNWEPTARKVLSVYLTGEEKETAEILMSKRRPEENKGSLIRQVRGAAEVLHNKETEEIGIN